MIAAKENYGMGFAATYLLLGMVDPFMFCFFPRTLMLCAFVVMFSHFHFVPFESTRLIVNFSKIVLDQKFTLNKKRA